MPRHGMRTVVAAVVVFNALVILGLLRGFYRDNGKKMETTRMGYIGLSVFCIFLCHVQA